MNEYPRAAAWITEALSSPAITGNPTISEWPVPQGLPYPAITFQLMGNEDVAEVAGDHIWAGMTFLVTAVTKGESTAALKALADVIDDRLDDQEFKVPAAAGFNDAMVVASVRNGLFKSEEVADGVPYRRLGGFFDLVVQPV